MTSQWDSLMQGIIGSWKLNLCPPHKHWAKHRYQYISMFMRGITMTFIQDQETNNARNLCKVMQIIYSFKAWDHLNNNHQ